MLMMLKQLRVAYRILVFLNFLQTADAGLHLARMMDTGREGSTLRVYQMLAARSSSSIPNETRIPTQVSFDFMAAVEELSVGFCRYLGMPRGTAGCVRGVHSGKGYLIGKCIFACMLVPFSAHF
jgi:hypothetical protein